MNVPKINNLFKYKALLDYSEDRLLCGFVFNFIKRQRHSESGFQFTNWTSKEKGKGKITASERYKIYQILVGKHGVSSGETSQT